MLRKDNFLKMLKFSISETNTRTIVYLYGVIIIFNNYFSVVNIGQKSSTIHGINGRYVLHYVKYDFKFNAIKTSINIGNSGESAFSYYAFVISFV